MTANLIYSLSLDKPVCITGDLNCNLLNAQYTETNRQLAFATNSKIESLAEGHNFVLHESAFTPSCFSTSEQFTFNYVDCKQVADVINAIP